MVDAHSLAANADRFAGFADLYDRVRPAPPDDLAPLLVSYAGGAKPKLAVDLGAGSGLSSRWAATWSDTVVGVEPGDDMRAIAERYPVANVRYQPGWSDNTGLDAGAADVVLAVQSLHWMEPATTFAEVARVLRPGGVFAAIDCDWPPTCGDVDADRAWDESRRIIRIYERRLAQGLTGDALAAPVDLGDAELRHHTPADTHANRTVARGVRSWSKEQHLARMVASEQFVWCHEVAMHHIEAGDAERFVDLLRSQGDYQSMRRAGLDDEQLGVRRLEAAAARAWNHSPRPLMFVFRVRIGLCA